jgi:starvation-inducible DNA-binding protein
MDGEIWRPGEQTSIDPIVICIDPQLEERNEVCAALTTLLADLFALYVKTKVFHWHTSGLGPRVRRLLLAEQADQVLMKRVRALGGTPIRSIGEISRLHPISDSAPADLIMREMLAALLRDSRQIAKQMRRAHTQCKVHGDFASARLLEDWIDEAEGRYWFLFEMHRDN